MPSKKKLAVTPINIDCIPLCILSIVLVFCISNDKDNALSVWKVSKKWRACVRTSMRFGFDTWDFKKYVLEPTDLIYYGISIWSKSMLHFVLVLWKFFQKKGFKLYITLKKPNIIYLHGVTWYNNIEIKIVHGCTIWIHELTSQICNIGSKIDGEVIIKAYKFSGLVIAPRGMDEILFSKNFDICKNEGSDMFDPDVILDHGDVTRLVDFIDNGDPYHGGLYCILETGPGSFALTVKANPYLNKPSHIFENNNTSRTYAVSKGIHSAEIGNWTFLIKHCGDVPWIHVKYVKDTNSFVFFMKCANRTFTFSVVCVEYFNKID